MSNIGNGMEKKAFGALTGVTSGFTMGNEFNSLSKISIMCGTQFQEYAPFQDSPEDLADELADITGNICGNILGGLTSFASVLGNEKILMQVFCVMSGKATQAGACIYDIKGLKKVVAGGAFLAKTVRKSIPAMLKGFIPQMVPNSIVLNTLGKVAGKEAMAKQIPIFLQMPTTVTIPFTPSLPSSYIIPVPEMTDAAIERHKGYNEKILIDGSNGKAIYENGKYIENQDEWGDVKFGISNMSFSGCEIIATYNALKALGE